MRAKPRYGYTSSCHKHFPGADLPNRVNHIFISDEKNVILDNMALRPGNAGYANPERLPFEPQTHYREVTVRSLLYRASWVLCTERSGAGRSHSNREDNSVNAFFRLSRLKLFPLY